MNENFIVDKIGHLCVCTHAHVHTHVPAYMHRLIHKTDR